MDEENLRHILNRSTDWNQAHGITGMLLYMEGRFLSQLEGRFMQVLEGSQQDIKDIFEQIKQDQRHHSIVVLNQTTAPQRNFENWSMGFQSLKLEACEKLPGFFDLNDEFLKSDELQRSSIPLNFLKTFYEMNIDHNT